jgi:hypothetical protein
MEEILNNLVIGEVLHVTANGTEYLFIGRSDDLGIVYSINQEQKTLPLNTINSAFISNNFGQEIDAQWYINFNQHEYSTRPCNLSVLRELLARI